VIGGPLPGAMTQISGSRLTCSAANERSGETANGRMGEYGRIG